MTKRKAIFLVIIFISFIVFAVLNIQKSNKNLKNFRDSFNLKFKGVILEIKYRDHGSADIKIKVVESNKAEYKDPGYLGFDYCNLKDSIANMHALEGHALEIGDSVFVGPSDFFVAKFRDDTIVGGKNSLDSLTYQRHNKSREY